MLIKEKLTKICFVHTAEEMNKNDDALKETVKKLWPIEAKKMQSLLIPDNEGFFKRFFYSMHLS